MPVDTEHQNYIDYSPSWSRCRDAIDGLDAMHKAGAKYLSMLSGQDNQLYQAYLKRADWYGAMNRTVQGLAGAAFRKDPTIELPDGLEPWEDDVTQTGVPIKVFSRGLLDDLLGVGRVGCYVDMADEGDSGEPYLIAVPAEAAINWRVGRIDGQQVLIRVVLKELIEEINVDDDFVVDLVEQYRVLEIKDEVYQVQLWRKDDKKRDFIPFGPPIIPTFRGRHLMDVPELRSITNGGIPFWFGGSTDLEVDAGKPPLRDLADHNIAYFRNSADLENALHYTGFPQAVAVGFPAKSSLQIGTASAWTSSEVNAKAFYMEYKGDGLGTVLENMARKKAEMAAMGARLLEEQKKSTEAAETVRLRQSGDQASLVGMVEVVEAILNKALSFAVVWAGYAADAVEIRLNKDLIAITATPEELNALGKALTDRNISFETFYHNLERLELTRPGVDADEEQEAIENSIEGELGKRLSIVANPPEAVDEEDIDAKVANIQAA